jgi:hypothetical protein
MSRTFTQPRELDAATVVDWLENWARWCLRGDARPSISVCDVGDWYENPQRHHHEAPRARVVPIPVYEPAAIMVERQVMGAMFPVEPRRAVRVRYIVLRDAVLLRDHLARERWDGKRSRAMGVKVPAYRDALALAHERLARDLWVWRHSLPRAA